MSLVGPLDAALSRIAPVFAGARSQIVDRYRSTAFRSRSRMALRVLEIAGVVPASGWVMGRLSWSDTEVAMAPIGPPGEPWQAIVKWPTSTDSLASLRTQSANLVSLRADQRLTGWSSLLPVILFEGEESGAPFFVESMMPGVPAHRLSGDIATRRRSLQAAAEAIAGLHARTAVPRTVDDEILELWIDRPVRMVSELIARRGGESAAVQALEVLATELRAAFAGRELTAGWIHGDYWLGNVLISPDGSKVTGIVDWDLASSDQPVLLDPVHLVLMARRTLSGREFGDVVRNFLTGGSLAPEERSALDASSSVQLSDPGEVRRAVQFAWLRHVGIFAAVGKDGSNPRWVRRNMQAVLKALPDVAHAGSPR
jgi:hypothetical protein